MGKPLKELPPRLGTPTFPEKWPSWPRVMDLDDALAQLRDVLESRCWTVRGERNSPCATERWEAEFARYIGRRHALAVQSGTAALEVTLLALGVGPGDEVIVPALGWFATAAAVHRVGAVPVYADVDPHTTCICPSSIVAKLTRRTRAVIAVHLHGAVADMNRISGVLRGHDAVLIEDAAQAHGAAYGGRRVGALGAVSCFSFNQEKLLACGEGGAVLTDDDLLFWRLHGLRTDGFAPPQFGQVAVKTCGDVRGGNRCMSDLQAALLLAQWKSFPAEQETRRVNAGRLRDAIRKIVGVDVIRSSFGTQEQAYYEFGFFVSDNILCRWPLLELAGALSGELGLSIHPTDGPPWLAPQLGVPSTGRIPEGARYVYEHLLVFHHSVLLDARIVQALPSALRRMLAARTI